MPPATAQEEAAHATVDLCRMHLEQRDLVQQTVQTGLDRAKVLYASRVPAFIQSSVERTSWLSQPLVSRISAMAPPVIRVLDNSLGAAYTKLAPPTAADGTAPAPAADGPEGEGELLVDERWFAQVDDLLRQRRLDAARFYASAADAFAGLRERTYGDFHDAMLRTLPDLEDRYAAPAKALFVSVAGALRQKPHLDAREVVASLQRVWAERVAPNARGVYDEALRYYAGVADRNPSVAQLVDGMQARFGDVWEGRMAAHLRDLFARAKESGGRGLAALPRPPAPPAAGYVPATRDALASAVESLRTRWASLLDSTEQAVDRVLPAARAGEPGSAPQSPRDPATGPAAEGAAPPATLRSVAGKVATRLRSRARQWPRRSARDLRRRAGLAAAHAGRAAAVAGRTLRTRRPANLPQDAVLLARQAVGADPRTEEANEFFASAAALAWTLACVLALAWVWAPSSEEEEEEEEETEAAIVVVGEGSDDDEEEVEVAGMHAPVPAPASKAPVSPRPWPTPPAAAKTGLRRRVSPSAEEEEETGDEI